jgi:hypothetical protein
VNGIWSTRQRSSRTPRRSIAFDFPNASNVLAATGLKTVGDHRQTASETLLSLQGLGQSSVDHLRKSLGVPSTEGVRTIAFFGYGARDRLAECAHPWAG